MEDEGGVERTACSAQNGTRAIYHCDTFACFFTKYATSKIWVQNKIFFKDFFLTNDYKYNYLKSKCFIVNRGEGFPSDFGDFAAAFVWKEKHFNKGVSGTVISPST